MDTNELAPKRGITILAKVTSIPSCRATVRPSPPGRRVAAAGTTGLRARA